MKVDVAFGRGATVERRRLVSEAGLSKHLRLLARAGLVRARREGYYVLYSVDLDRVSTLSEVVLLFLAGPSQDPA